jgi:hypothetical protein
MATCPPRQIAPSMHEMEPYLLERDSSSCIAKKAIHIRVVTGEICFGSFYHPAPTTAALEARPKARTIDSLPIQWRTTIRGFISILGSKTCSPMLRVRDVLIRAIN